MGNKKKLFLCNTVYQIIIASWMKYKMYPEDSADIIVSDHMNGYKKIAENLKATGLFDEVYAVESLEVSRHKVPRKNKYDALIKDCMRSRELKNYFKINYDYDELYVSNLDGFTKMLFSVLHKKFGTKICMFEDGISTYSKLYEKFYENCNPIRSKHDFFVYKIFKNESVYGNVVSLWILNKDALLWKPKYEVKQIPAIVVDDNYRAIINRIFDYESLTDKYEEKYIYFEESFFADTGYMEDVELVNKISEVVGKENILIKIHPRNPENRFEKLGYKTNKDTSTPWEVILLNKNFDDKVLITIASTSILSPVNMLGKNIKAYSMINCINIVPKSLEGDLFDAAKKFFNDIDAITVCENIGDIK